MIKKGRIVVCVIACCWSVMLVAINEIADDFGNSVSGPGVTVASDGLINGNGTSSFIISGTTIMLVFDDKYNNIGFGANVLSKNSSGFANVVIGENAGEQITGGGNNVIVGVGGCDSLINGTSNVILGAAAGTAYTGSESNNTLLNDTGQTGDNGVIRIAVGSATACYIGGIAANNLSGASSSPMAINSSTGQLGTMSYVVNPNQPAFFAYTSATSSGFQQNVTGNGTLYSVSFDTALFNQASAYDNNQNFIAPIAGIYQFKAAVNLSGLSDSSYVTLDLLAGNPDSGLTVYRLAAESLVTTGSPITLAGDTLIQMNVDDVAYIGITVTLENGGQTVGIEGGNTPIVTYFTGNLLT